MTILNGARVVVGDVVVVASAPRALFGVYAFRLPFECAAVRSELHLAGLLGARQLASHQQPVKPCFGGATGDRVRRFRSSTASAHTSECP